MVVSRGFGLPVVIRPGDSAMEEATRSDVFNRINWDQLHPASGAGLVDSNASPFIFWEPGQVTDTSVGVSAIGSQADSMAAVSPE